MFDRLSERLKNTFKNFSKSPILSENQVDEALKEIRRSLLEADVHFKVVKELIEKIREKAIGQRVWEKLSPAQQVVQIFHEELIETLGGKDQKLPSFEGKPPFIVLVVGLQGSGKTTFCSKLALYLKKKMKKSVGLLPADCARPAAKTQLQILGQKVEAPVFDSPLDQGAVSVARVGLEWAQKNFFDVLIVDTAGRQQVDQALMQELSEVENVLNPNARFLVLDAMIGSQGLEVARIFHEQVQLTGLALSKLDGDARGGAALSARQVTGVPIAFVGVGEKPEDFEPFHPDRMASRILGMGDVLTLIEKAQETVSEEEALASTEKMFSGQFSLEDFRDQLKTIQRMGPLEGLMKLIPGVGSALEEMKKSPNAMDPQKELKKLEAIMNSMTPYERRNHGVLNGSRKLRIAKGSGTNVAEINRFLKQFMEMSKMMKQFSKMGFGAKGMRTMGKLLGNKKFF